MMKQRLFPHCFIFEVPLRGNNEETTWKQRGNKDETTRKQRGNKRWRKDNFQTNNCLKIWIFVMCNCPLSINRSNKISKLRNKL